MTTTTTTDATRAGHGKSDTYRVRVPLVGTFALSGPELAYLGGVAGLSVLGLIEWPIGLVLVGGQLLTADRSSRDARELGAAMSLA